MKVRLSGAAANFFEVEIRNEDQGGVRPATLGSANESLCQAPDDVVASWANIKEDKVEKLAQEVDALIETLGGDYLLCHLLKDCERQNHDA